MLFLEQAVSLGDAAVGGAVLGGLMALMAAFLFIAVILWVGIYVYTSLVFMAIAKKTKTTPAGIAWIPGIGPAILTSKIAKMHWWPILLLIGVFIPYIGIIAELAFAVFFVIWLWKTFEAVDRPGWWAILCLLPIVNLVLLGIAAWSKK